MAGCASGVSSCCFQVNFITQYLFHKSATLPAGDCFRSSSHSRGSDLDTLLFDVSIQFVARRPLKRSNSASVVFTS